VGTSHRVVAKAKRKPNRPVGAYAPNLKPFTNPEKCEPWRSRPFASCALTISPSKRTAEQRVFNPANSRWLRVSSNPLEARQIVWRRPKTYGFPTVANASFRRCPRFDRRSRPSVAADRTISLSRAKPSHKALTLAAEVDASAWPGCNFNFHKFCVHSMGQSWRVQGEYLFGGTGTLTAVGGRFDPTCDWPGTGLSADNGRRRRSRAGG
jgi:hypothetical protein